MTNKIGDACPAPGTEKDDGLIEKVITHSHHHHDGHGDHSHVNHIFYSPYDNIPVQGYHSSSHDQAAALISQLNQK